MRLTRQGPSLVVHTPAKLNLFLNVLGRRQDGFHDLETLMVSIRLYDTIRFESVASPDLELSCRSLRTAVMSLPFGPDNLVHRAATLLQHSCRISRGARICLFKRIPSEAGMGGGSSDAAATLVALNQCWELGLGRSRLHELASELGSDVNFFLDSSLASACSGRGELTRPVALGRPLHFVVVKPPLGLSTGRVFQAWGQIRTTTTTSLDSVASRLADGHLEHIRHGLFNSLEGPARELSADVDRLLGVLARLDVAASGMTGSGSACFGLCRSARQALGIARRLRGLRLGQIYAVSTGI